RQSERGWPVLFKLEGDVLVPQLLIRGGGDRGYNGMEWHDGFLWLVYNAPSRELGKSSIYFCKISSSDSDSRESLQGQREVRQRWPWHDHPGAVVSPPGRGAHPSVHLGRKTARFDQ